MQERNGEPDFSKKHPLEYKWTLWFDNPKGTQNQNNWGQTLRAVYTFDTVEDFWWYGLTRCSIPISEAFDISLWPSSKALYLLHTIDNHCVPTWSYMLMCNENICSQLV